MRGDAANGVANGAADADDDGVAEAADAAVLACFRVMSRSAARAADSCSAAWAAVCGSQGESSSRAEPRRRTAWSYEHVRLRS